MAAGVLGLLMPLGIFGVLLEEDDVLGSLLLPLVGLPTIERVLLIGHRSCSYKVIQVLY